MSAFDTVFLKTSSTKMKDTSPDSFAAVSPTGSITFLPSSRMKYIDERDIGEKPFGCSNSAAPEKTSLMFSLAIFFGAEYVTSVCLVTTETNSPGTPT